MQPSLRRHSLKAAVKNAQFEGQRGQTLIWSSFGFLFFSLSLSWLHCQGHKPVAKTGQSDFSVSVSVSTWRNGNGNVTSKRLNALPSISLAELVDMCV